ncbi:peptidoglycan-binding domain-containing protein [Protofrankia symbiont of Coriaria ruscifolia]|uniref:peptidoglycan-binding domain-containing protein n=1 Tax=Protofrankia symbiont of Coriaria ruscifolia TaxID=1306542 RepID=UPI001A945D29|nr:peptidoglycan-binding domain-containing protein [Protofrankia symbiont of Coriaria ruscifolia]
MEPLLPGTLWRPLAADNPEPAIVPRVLIIHTMVGYLLGTESMFRAGGYDGTESTFGVGGEWDGQYDGVAFQWQRLDRQADANYAANAYANSVETSDGGDPSRPWGARQLAALITLTATWCRVTGNPPVLVGSPNGHGIGYHSQFANWNLSSHTCPGPVRIQQLLDIVIPGAAAIFSVPPPAPVVPVVAVSAPPLAPAFPLPAGHWYGPPSPDPRSHSGFYSATDRTGLNRWQAQMRARGWAITPDGRFGPQSDDVCRRFQNEKGLAVDGHVGPITWAAAWTAPVT